MTEETYYQKNRERLLANSKKYYEANKEKAAAYQAEYRAKNKSTDPPKKRGPKGPRLSPEEKQQRLKEANKKYYAENREKVRAQQAKWISENKDHLAQYKREYFKNNTSARIAHNIRARLRKALNSGGKSKKGSAVTLLCMEISDFKDYISSKFTEGMSWDNYGDWHLDHIIPLASFDLEDPYQLAQACHYSNYQPLWAVDNSAKGARY